MPEDRFLQWRASKIENTSWPKTSDKLVKLSFGPIDRLPSRSSSVGRPGRRFSSDGYVIGRNIRA